MQRRPRLIVATAAAALCLSGQAFAQPRLVGSTPTAGSVAPKLATIELKFSDALSATPPIVDLTMTGMPGMASHDPMKIAGFKTVVSADRKAVTVTLPRPLPAGSYKLDWQATAGSKPGKGTVLFSAK